MASTVPGGKNIGLAKKCEVEPKYKKQRSYLLGRISRNQVPHQYKEWPQPDNYPLASLGMDAIETTGKGSTLDKMYIKISPEDDIGEAVRGIINDPRTTFRHNLDDPDDWEFMEEGEQETPASGSSSANTDIPRTAGITHGDHLAMAPQGI